MVIDPLWCDGKKIVEVEPYNCPCCNKCWLITKGTMFNPKISRCVYGGPYLGYINVEEEQDKTGKN